MPQHWIGGVFFARGVSPCQKWWQSPLGREISCSQWEGPSMHSRCLSFFPFMFWGGGPERFFSILLGFPSVHTMFLSSSQWVPNIFPNNFSIPPHFYPICLEANGKVQHPFRCPNFLIWVLRARGRGEVFFLMSCSCVPTMFPSCSPSFQCVPQGCSK